MDPFSAILGIFGAGLGGLAGQQQADAQNRATEATYQQNKLSWEYGKKVLDLDYGQRINEWHLNQRNDETISAWKDATNLQDWNYGLKIQNYEYASQMRQYNRSHQIADRQLTFNAMAQAAANEAEYRKLEDATKEIAFQNQDLIVKTVQSEGAAAVRGQQGRSAEKAGQVELASLGRNQAILAESLLSARADSQAALRKIAADKYGADLAANASRMLKPQRLPSAPKPLTTPRTEFLKPRQPTEYDYGPAPIKGAMASSTGSWLNAGANAMQFIPGLFK